MVGQNNFILVSQNNFILVGQNNFILVGQLMLLCNVDVPVIAGLCPTGKVFISFLTVLQWATVQIREATFLIASQLPGALY